MNTQPHDPHYEETRRGMAGLVYAVPCGIAAWAIIIWLLAVLL
jgi:hypothetical protein